MTRPGAGTAVVVLATIALLPAATFGQDGQKTPWGDPDLQGSYSFKTTTPFQRPDDMLDREFLSAEEVEAGEQAVLEQNLELLLAPAERTQAGGDIGMYNYHWLEAGTRSTGRTSILVDPPDGRLPAPTPDGKRRHAEHYASFTVDGPFDSWENFEVNDRCLFWLAGPPMLPTFYNNNVMLLQTPDYVVLYVEMIHDARIIPLDGRPHLPTDHRQWLGDARGYWDGDTLVVETRNIRRTEANASTGAGDVILLRVANGRTDDTITVTERFTRLDGDTLRYEFTVDDPTQWTQTFSGELPLVALPPEQGIFEYACHEGNYSIVNILAGARAQE